MPFWSGEKLQEEVMNCIKGEYDNDNIDCAALIFWSVLVPPALNGLRTGVDHLDAKCGFARVPYGQ